MDFRKYNKIKSQIDSYQYISFDLFDTLIKRDYAQPINLFQSLEKFLNYSYQDRCKSNFSEKRLQAEKKARYHSQYEEITLDEIYQQLQNWLPVKSIEYIKKMEQEYEYSCCQWNPLMQDVYKYAINQNKKILIITDIYLSKELIEKILNKLQIRYDFLFVSSEERKTKNSGELFQKVLQVLKCKPQEILHIGDNYKSDYVNPKKIGIKSIQIPRDDKINLYIHNRMYKKNQEYADLCAFINNHSIQHDWNIIETKSDYDYFKQAGYEVQGPLLYSFIQWLEKQIEQQKIDRVFFLARDGQLMQKAYNILAKPIENQYMYASRRALITPALWMNPSLKDISNTITFLKQEKIGSILKRIGLSPDQYKRLFELEKFDWEKEYNTVDLFNNPKFQSVYDKYIKEDMISSSHEQYLFLVRYLNQINFKGNVAIVDIGWYGNMQRALSKVIEKARIPAKIHGFYIGLNPFEKVLEDSVAKGFLFDQNYNIDLFRKERMFNSIFEILFTANHGTTLGYKEKDSKIFPVLDHWEYGDDILRNDYKKIEAIQNGAVEFIKDAIISTDGILSTKAYISFMNWICLGFYPDHKCAENFGNLHMLDDELRYIAKPQYMTYGFHIKNMLRDLKKSLWSIGFLTLLYGDRFPYGNIYYFVRDIVKGKNHF